MTLRIEVTVPEDAIRNKEAASYLADAMAAIGFSRGVSLPMPAPVRVDEQGRAVQSATASDAPTGLTAQGTVGLLTVAEAAPVVQTEPTRERGKPAPGRARRTKEEIAEDEAADKIDAEYARSYAAKVEAEEAEQANISTGEERVDPADIAAQDKADEKAEVEEHRKALTVDDLKSVMGGYVKKFGMEATQEDGPKIFTEALGAPPAGQPAWKVSLLDGDQERLAKAVDMWTKAVDLNPLKRALAGA